MSVEKTYAEINAKIRSGKAVVVTAEELIARWRKKASPKQLKKSTW